MLHNFKSEKCNFKMRGRRGCDCMVVGFTTSCVISTYHH